MSGRVRKGAPALVVAALSVVVVASIASAKPAAEPASEAGAAQQRTLNIYGYGPGDDVAQTRTAHNQRVVGPNVEIENPRGGFNTQAFLAMLASGSVPDVMWVSRGLIGSLAARGALQPLTSCIRKERVNLKQYRGAALREVTYKNRVYALPAFTNQITIVVNDDVARQSGVNPNRFNTTSWRKLRQWNKKMLRVEGGRVTRIGFDPKIPEFFPLWVKWFGAELISRDGLKAKLNSRQAIAALSYTYSLIQDHGGWDRFKAFRDTHNWFGRNNPIVADQIGATPFESFIYNVLANNSPNEELTARFFTNRRGGPITLFAGNGWAIPRGAKDPDLACKWMKADTSVEAWVAAARNRLNLRRRQGEAFTGLYTANKRADVKVFEDIYQPLGKRQFDDAVKLLVRAADFGFALPPSPGSDEFRQAYIDAVNRVLTGRQSPRQALNQAQREAQAAINRNRR